MTNITAFPLQRLSADSLEDSLRIIVFNVSQYMFALPVGAVQKIIICPPTIDGISEGIGIVNLGSFTATVLDLRYKFVKDIDRETLPTLQRRFLILIDTKEGDPCGIIVPRPPIIKDIPLSAIVPVPRSYRQVKQLNFTSHMVVLSEADSDRADPDNIFLLGMEDIFASLT